MVQSDASGTAERPVNDSGRDAQGPEHRALPDVLPPSYWQQVGAKVSKHETFFIVLPAYDLVN